MAHEHCKLHISGLYHKMGIKGGKSFHITSPILLIKSRHASEDYLLPNCSSVIKLGEVLEAYEYLCEAKAYE